jgi:hypothetical protein
MSTNSNPAMYHFPTQKPHEKIIEKQFLCQNEKWYFRNSQLMTVFDGRKETMTPYSKLTILSTEYKMMT